MAIVEVKCPHCAKIITVKSEWSGMELECPVCQGRFMAPSMQAPSAAPQQAKSKNSGEKSEISSYMVKKIIKVVLILILIGIGVLLFLHFTAVTPESMQGNQLYAMTQKRANRDGAMGVSQIAEHDFFPIVNIKKNFFYRNASFKKIYVVEKERDLYSGTVTFTRNGKNMTRPVIVDRRKTFTHYRFPVDYAKNPKYLEEDGDLIFALAGEIDGDLKEWQYKRGKVDPSGLLICEVAKGGENKTVKLKVQLITGEDKIERVWMELVE